MTTTTDGLRNHEPVHVISPTATLRDAAETLAFYGFGCLPVVEEDVLIGIFTEHDLVRAIAEDSDLAKLPVSEYMTPGPLSVDQSATFDAAWELMVKHGTRHVPVTHGDRVVGMVSARDVMAGLLLVETLRG